MNELTKLTDEQKEALQKPLPPEAVKPHPTKSYLSTINAIYVIERFNEVFGVGEWTQEVEVIEAVAKMKVVKVTFSVAKHGIKLEQFGGNDNADAGDAFKGAVTDALTKIGSYLGIGMDVWKDKSKKDAPKTSKVQPWQIEKIKALMKERSVTKEDIHDMGFGSAKDLTFDTAEELIKTLKATKSKIINGQVQP